MSGPRRGTTVRPGGGSATRGAPKQAVELFTLGGVRIVRAGADMTGKLGSKHLALLIYVYHEGRPMHPSEVIDLVGRGQDWETEMDGLRRAVAHMSQKVPGIHVKLSSETIEAIGGVQLDTREVDDAIDSGDCKRVAELYVGDFLQGFRSDSETFDDWAARESARLRRAWSNAVVSAARAAEQLSDWAAAATWWGVLVAHAPTQADLVVSQIRAHLGGDDEQGAARALGDYLSSLGSNGASEPAGQVQQIIAQYPRLKDLAEKHRPSTAPQAVTPPPAAPGPRRAASPPVPESRADVESGSGKGSDEIFVPGLERRGLASAAEGAGQKNGGETESPSSPASAAVPDAGSIDGLELGTPPPLRDTSSSSQAPPERIAGLQTGAMPPVHEDASPPAPEQVAPSPKVSPSAPPPILEDPSPADPWDEIAAMDTGDDLELDVPGIHPTLEQPALEPEPGDLDAARRSKRHSLDRNDPLYHAAVSAFKDTNYDRVRHQVTSVHKPFSKVVADYWQESAPLRETALHYTVVGLKKLGVLLWQLLTLAFTGAKALGRRLLRMRGGVGAVRQRMKSAGKGVAGLGRRTKAAGRALTSRPKEPKPRTSTTIQPKAPAPPAPKAAAEPRSLGTSEVGAAAAAMPTFEAVVEAPPKVSRKARAKKKKAAKRAKLAVKAPRLPRLSLRPAAALLRRFWYAPLAVVAVTGAVIAGPRLVEMVGGLKDDVRTPSLPDVSMPEVSMPDVSLPDVSLPKVTVPKVRVRAPSFFRTTVGRIRELLAGPILEGRGDWVVLADLETGELAEYRALAGAMTLALEAELSQATFFRVVPRERALIALRRSGGRNEVSLPREDGLRVAGELRIPAVITGEIFRSAATTEGGEAGERAAVDSLKLVVLDPSGSELYGVSTALSDARVGLEALATLTGQVRKRLGEPEEELAGVSRVNSVLSENLGAIRAYGRARAHLFAGRYRSAIAEAAEAARLDPGFVAAYLLQAEAYALNGQRRQARRALETAHENRERATARERLRIQADRLAWDGRLSDALATYEELFQRYRDDVRSLKSLAVLQRKIGARGGGNGNLRVAYSIDPLDWPPLWRVASYLDYQGRLPDVDSLVSSIQASP